MALQLSCPEEVLALTTPRHRQLAPTVGQRTSGVSFWTGSTGGIGDSITVGLVSKYDAASSGYVKNDAFWTPAKENPAAWTLVPIGGFDIFVGFTTAAFGALDLSYCASTTHPMDSEDGSDLAFLQKAADNNLCYDADDEFGFADYSQASELHFMGNVEGSGSIRSDADPESILPVLQTGIDSEAGSVDNTPMQEDSESDDDDFSRKVAAICGVTVTEVLMEGTMIFPLKTQLLAKSRMVKASLLWAQAPKTKPHPGLKKRKTR